MDTSETLILIEIAKAEAKFRALDTKWRSYIKNFCNDDFPKDDLIALNIAMEMQECDRLVKNLRIFLPQKIGEKTYWK